MFENRFGDDGSCRLKEFQPCSHESDRTYSFKAEWSIWLFDEFVHRRSVVAYGCPIFYVWRREATQDYSVLYCCYIDLIDWSTMFAVTETRPVNSVFFSSPTLRPSFLSIFTYPCTCPLRSCQKPLLIWHHWGLACLAAARAPSVPRGPVKHRDRAVLSWWAESLWSYFVLVILCHEMFQQLETTFFVSHWCRSLVSVWYIFALYVLFASAARE